MVVAGLEGMETEAGVHGSLLLPPHARDDPAAGVWIGWTWLRRAQCCSRPGVGLACKSVQSTGCHGGAQQATHTASSAPPPPLGLSGILPALQ